ncbi:hypothetical protein GGR56DRAFT_383958 [Xylariaceae sp. FL0804]|nr:hypothetical protein GGR56DRAFT_383958 [Xylariaceae sp. FL0804]
MPYSQQRGKRALHDAAERRVFGSLACSWAESDEDPEIRAPIGARCYYSQLLRIRPPLPRVFIFLFCFAAGKFKSFCFATTPAVPATFIITISLKLGRRLAARNVFSSPPKAAHAYIATGHSPRRHRFGAVLCAFSHSSPNQHLIPPHLVEASSYSLRGHDLIRLIRVERVEVGRTELSSFSSPCYD